MKGLGGMFIVLGEKCSVYLVKMSPIKTHVFESFVIKPIKQFKQ